MITLTKIKVAGGEETPRFDAVLNWNGAPVALVSNAGHGGACHVLWQAKLNGPPTPMPTRTAVLRAALELAQREEPELFAAAGPMTALDYVLVSEVETERQNLSEQVRNDLTLYRNLAVRIPSLSTSLQSTRQIQEAWERQFLAGRKSWLEVMNAVREIQQAESQLIEAQTNQMQLSWRLTILAEGGPRLPAPAR